MHQSNSKYHTLPREIRDRIGRYILVVGVVYLGPQPSTYFITSPNDEEATLWSKPNIGILGTCRLMYEEGRQIFWSANTLQIPAGRGAIAAETLSRLQPESRELIKNVVLDITLSACSPDMLFDADEDGIESAKVPAGFGDYALFMRLYYQSDPWKNARKVIRPLTWAWYLNLEYVCQELEGVQEITVYSDKLSRNWRRSDNPHPRIPMSVNESTGHVTCDWELRCFMTATSRRYHQMLTMKAWMDGWDETVLWVAHDEWRADGFYQRCTGF